MRTAGAQCSPKSSGTASIRKAGAEVWKLHWGVKSRGMAGARSSPKSKDHDSLHTAGAQSSPKSKDRDSLHMSGLNFCPKADMSKVQRWKKSSTHGGCSFLAKSSPPGESPQRAFTRGRGRESGSRRRRTGVFAPMQLKGEQGKKLFLYIQLTTYIFIFFLSLFIVQIGSKIGQYAMITVIS